MASSFSFEIKRRPRMLKDFLEDEIPSCSSNDLLSSCPPKPCKMRAGRLSKPNKTPSELPRSRSKAASISISAVHKASDMVINAIKFKLFPFASIKTPAILPRSISRKLSRRNEEDRNNVVVDEESAKVKIKDILRWKSFRDVVMELEEIPWPTPLAFSCSQNQCNTTTISAGSSGTGSSSSQRSSCCESDFTVEDLSSCCSEDKDYMNENGTLEFGKNYLQEFLVGTTTGTASKRKVCFDEEDQHSPVSVLDSPFREDEEFFHRSLATVERKKCRLMQRIQEFESLAQLEPVKELEKDRFLTEEDSANFFEEDEETNGTVDRKARQLLHHIKTMRSGKDVKAADSGHDHLLLDFFHHEIMALGGKIEQNEAKSDGEMLRLAESWLNKEYSGSLDWEMLGRREDCLRDMEKGLRWNSFEEEQQELGCILEIEVLNDLFHEILVDIRHQ